MLRPRRNPPRRGASAPLEVRAFVAGVQAVLPAPLLAAARRVFAPEELGVLLAGAPRLDLGDWVESTVYELYAPEDDQVRWSRAADCESLAAEHVWRGHVW